MKFNHYHQIWAQSYVGAAMIFGVGTFRDNLAIILCCFALSGCASATQAPDFYRSEKTYYENMLADGPEELRSLAGDFVKFGWDPAYEIAIEKISSRFMGADQWIVVQDINYTGSVFTVRAAYRIDATPNWRMLYYRHSSFWNDPPQIQSGICGAECEIEAKIMALANVESDISTLFQLDAPVAYVTAFDGTKVIRRAILSPSIYSQAKPTEIKNSEPVAPAEKDRGNTRDSLKGPITEIGTVDLHLGIITNWDNQNHQRLSEIIAGLESLREKITMVDEPL